MARFIGNVVIRGKIECLTGLHIGAGKDTSEIGGVDSPVVHDPVTRMPYIPGSSLKGKMRSLLEFATGKVHDGSVHTCSDPGCEVCRIFGSSAQETRSCGPTRLLVRDAYPDDETKEMWKRLDSDLPFTEVKSENFLDRLTSAANPRFIERVVKGSRFNLDMVYGVYEVDGKNDLDFFDSVSLSLRLFEDSALGGSGSRGYGQVRLRFSEPVFVDCADYRNGGGGLEQSRSDLNADAFKHGVSEIRLNRSHPTCKQWDEALA